MRSVADPPQPLPDPEWTDDAAAIARRRAKELRRRHPHKEAKASFESALTVACFHSGLTKGRARLFLTCLVEEIASRLVRGEIVRVPRLALVGIVPLARARKFRVAFFPDPALRLKVHQEMYEPSRESYRTFYGMCRSLLCMLPSYKRRGSTFAGLMARDRQRAMREDRQQVTVEECERALGFCSGDDD